MISELFVTTAALSLILLIEWRQLKQANLTTRLLSFILLGLSGVLWIYSSTVVNIQSPGEILETWLR